MAGPLITPAQLLELREHIRTNLQECDNTHSLARRWLAEHGMEFEGENRELIADCGGCCCDCEIGWNFPSTIPDIEARLSYVSERRSKRAN